MGFPWHCVMISTRPVLTRQLFISSGCWYLITQSSNYILLAYASGGLEISTRPALTRQLFISSGCWYLITQSSNYILLTYVSGGLEISTKPALTCQFVITSGYWYLVTQSSNYILLAYAGGVTLYDVFGIYDYISADAHIYTNHIALATVVMTTVLNYCRRAILAICTEGIAWNRLQPYRLLIYDTLLEY